MKKMHTKLRKQEIAAKSIVNNTYKSSIFMQKVTKHTKFDVLNNNITFDWHYRVVRLSIGVC